MKNKLLFLFFLGLTVSSFAQRKSKKDKVEKSELYIHQEAEYYFTEGIKQFILEDYAKAVNNFRSSLQLVPDNDVVYYKLAQIFNTTNQLDLAIESITKAISINDNNAYYYYLAADIFTNANNLKEAAIYYERLLERIPGEENAYFQLGAIYLYLQAYPKAINAYQRAEDFFGINEQSTTQKQKIYLKLNEPDKAIDEGQKLIEAYPANSKFVVMQAELLSANGYNTQAITLVKNLLATNPEAASTRLLLADLYRKQKNLEAFEQQLTLAFKNPTIELSGKVTTLSKYMALLPDSQLEQLLPTLADELVKTHPGKTEAVLLQADVYAAFIEKGLVEPGRVAEYKQKAIDAYAWYITQNEANYNVWQTLLNFELQLDQYKQVIAHGEQALVVFPNQAWLYLVTGVAYMGLSQWDDAIFYLEEGTKRATTNNALLEMFYTYLGDVAHQAGYHQKSDAYYDKVLQLNPANELVLNNYSYYLSLREQKLEKANQMVNKLMRMNSENSAYLDTYAWVQFKLGNYYEAKRVLEKIIATKKPNAENYDHYGDVLFKLGQKEKAIAQWKKAKALDNSIKHINEKIEQGKIIQ